LKNYTWFKCFKNGKTPTYDNGKLGKPSTLGSEPLNAQMKTLSVKIVN
jgi:hypothetical protein